METSLVLLSILAAIVWRKMKEPAASQEPIDPEPSPPPHPTPPAPPPVAPEPAQVPLPGLPLPPPPPSPPAAGPFSSVVPSPSRGPITTAHIPRQAPPGRYTVRRGELLALKLPKGANAYAFVGTIPTGNYQVFPSSQSPGAPVFVTSEYWSVRIEATGTVDLVFKSPDGQIVARYVFTTI